MGQDIYGTIEIRHESGRHWITAVNLRWMSRWPDMQSKLFYSGELSGRGLPKDAARETKNVFNDALVYSKKTHAKYAEFYPAYSYYRSSMDHHTSDHWDLYAKLMWSFAHTFGYENTRTVVGFHH